MMMITPPLYFSMPRAGGPGREDPRADIAVGGGEAARGEHGGDGPLGQEAALLRRQEEEGRGRRGQQRRRR